MKCSCHQFGTKENKMSFPRKRESREKNWIPVFTGMTVKEDFSNEYL